MKKILLLAVLAVASVVGLNAQGLRLGIIGGANVSNMNLEQKDRTESSDPLAGFHAGLKAELGFMSSNSGPYLDAALLYSTKGAKLTDNANLRVNYLELPVHIGYKIGLGEHFGLFAHVGPYVGYGLSATAEFGDLSYKLFDEKTESPWMMKRFDAGVSAGVGVEMVKNFQVSLNYSKGLTNIAKTEQAKITNSNVSVSLAYMF